MPNIFYNIQIAWDSMAAARFRTAASVLGIILGVMAVIVVGSISMAGKRLVASELETFGPASLWISRDNSGPDGRLNSQFDAIDVADVSSILASCGSVKRVAPVVSKHEITARFQGRSLRVKAIFTTSDYLAVNNDTVERGRVILPSDDKSKNHICVIGKEVAAELFPNRNPLGASMRVGDNKYEIVGVLKSKERALIQSLAASGKYNADDRVVIPISVYHYRYNTSEVQHLQAQAVEPDLAYTAGMEIKETLGRNHGYTNQYRVETLQQYIDISENVLRIMSWIGAVTAIISLVVGGIGIMNIMTVSVLERTLEIGIRRALGAARADILAQFLAESICVGLSGGLAGALIGAGLVSALGFLSEKPVTVSGGFVVLALAASLATGLISGIYPAARAAFMDPVDALRHQ